MADLARLTIAPNELAAEEIRSLLRTEGIESMQRKTDFAVGMTDASTSAFGAREILVNPDDLEAARALIAED
ncbi:MAG: DUF2007 domain-containing protein [Actinobacteria bacterium]|nr:MAG: DUF2007 domain-containing protein [Actinomycetota bacterium]